MFGMMQDAWWPGVTFKPKGEPDVKKPELQDFGITSEEYEHYLLKSRTISQIVPYLSLLAICTAFLATGVIAFFLIRTLGGTLVGGAGGLFLVVCLYILCFRLALRVRESNRSGNQVNLRVEQYEEVKAAYMKSQYKIEQARLQAKQSSEQERLVAERARLRKIRDYWESLRDTEFEDELAAVYRSLGFQVGGTPKTGDQGVDLILKKDGKTTVVQCKGQQARAGSPVVLSLIGARENKGADSAILACTAGFTQGARDVAKRNEVKLISARDIARIAGGIAVSRPEQATLSGTALSEPKGPECPTCGSETILQDQWFGNFWRCCRFPKCKGVRYIHQAGPQYHTSATKPSQVEESVNQFDQSKSRPYAQAALHNHRLISDGRH